MRRRKDTPNSGRDEPRIDARIRSIQPGGGTIMRLELAWGYVRRWYLWMFRRGYVERMQRLRKGTENRCPHKKDMVLSRGLLGTQGDEPKVACPLHKKTFSLRTGKGLSDPAYCIRTFPVEIRDDGIFVKLPPAAEWVTKRENVAKGHGCGGRARTRGDCGGLRA